MGPGQSTRREQSETETGCPVCSGPSRQALLKDGHAIFGCDVCGFLFVHPYPSQGELDAFYNADYRGVDRNFYPKAASRRRRAFVRSLPLAAHVWGKSVLELGCGGGFMTAAFATWAKRAVGIDLSQAAIDYAAAHFPKAAFRCETLAACAARGETFDFVFSSELFEHLPGVDKVMAGLMQVTRPGGLVYVSTPDASHPARPADLSQWSDICPPEHLQWFGRDSLTRLFRNHGFEPYKLMRNPKPAHSALFRRSQVT